MLFFIINKTNFIILINFFFFIVSAYFNYFKINILELLKLTKN